MGTKHSAGAARVLPPRAFYCMADSRYFLGAVALINSLRLVGHTEQIVFLDCGLDDRQRVLLDKEAEVLPLVHSAPSVPPFLQRGRGPLARPAAAMLLVDVDMIVTRSLEPLFQLAEEGKVVAVADFLSGRFSDKWQTALGLRSVRRQTYINTGLMALPVDTGTRLLQMLEESVHKVDFTRTFWTEGAEDDPFFFLDQDVVNALLASEFPQQLLAVLPYQLAPHPPFVDLSLEKQTRQVRYPDGTEPFVLHHTMRKPWLSRVPPNLYSELLSDLLLGPELPLQLRKEEVPRRLQRGLLGALGRTRVRVAGHGRGIVRSMRSKVAVHRG